MESTCLKFQSGAFNSDNPEHVIAQLRAEGKRRIDAFVFEQIFRYRLKKTMDQHPQVVLSFGWHIGYNQYGQPAYWFRIMNADDDWNACDDVMTERLGSLRIGPCQNSVKVFRVQHRASENSFYSSEYMSGTWQKWTLLRPALEKLPSKGKETAPRPMENRAPETADIAFEWLRKTFRSGLAEISIQRRFLNCFIRPCLGRDGSDIDALVLTPNQQLRCIEFKRKYPATGTQRFFGIDAHPHVRTIRTMAEMDISSLHILLVGPRWRKDESPVAWLNNPAWDSAWTWLAANLDGDAFEPIKLHTSGSDSGQRPGERTQSGIRWSRIQLLNKGLKFDAPGSRKLVTFLEDGQLPAAAPMDFKALFDRQVF